MDGFNPLPPPKRGETHAVGPAEDLVEVSIHSPRRSEGRLFVTEDTDNVTGFQSTPPAEARGDARWPRLRRAWKSCFNPLPPPKRGETTD